jgi:ketosteroid isomerase-like protein
VILCGCPRVVSGRRSGRWHVARLLRPKRLSWSHRAASCRDDLHGLVLPVYAAAVVEADPPIADVARRFAAALGRGDADAAALLLADDAELVFPGATVRGREAWRQARAGPAQSEQHLAESVEDAVFIESGETVEMTGRLVQRWAETGEVANEQALRVRFWVAGGLISRLEFVPGP